MNDNYNGWTNYETWLASLWLDNEPACYEYWRERTRLHLEAAESDNLVVREVVKVEQAARYNLASELENEVRENAPTDDYGVYADLLNAACSRVEWQEIAEHWITEIQNE